MKIQFDPEKSRANIIKQGISLDRASDMRVLERKVDDREDYGERRYRLYGTIDGLDHCLVCTFREDHIRVISLRRAHAKEMRRYVPRDPSRR